MRIFNAWESFGTEYDLAPSFVQNVERDNNKSNSLQLIESSSKKQISLILLRFSLSLSLSL